MRGYGEILAYGAGRDLGTLGTMVPRVPDVGYFVVPDAFATNPDSGDFKIKENPGHECLGLWVAGWRLALFVHFPAIIDSS